MVVPAYPDHAVLRIKYNQTCFVFYKLLRIGNSAWDFLFWWAGGGGGVIFGLGIFWGFFFASIRSTPSLEIWNTLPGYCTDMVPP